MSDPDLDLPVDPQTWVETHGDALFRYAMLRLRDREIAEEMVQECFVAALDARHSFAAQSSVRTWLIGILKRKIVDYLRRCSRQRRAEEQMTEVDTETSFFDDRGLWRQGPHRWGGDPGRAVESRELQAALRQCLDRLPANLADPFLLREMNHLESEEICQVLDITATNLWARLHRARLILRDCLEKNWFRSSRRRQG